MKVVIMAGGKGTRISSVVSDIPKPMIKIEGIPVLEREIECLKEQGFDDILITVSHLGNIIIHDKWLAYVCDSYDCKEGFFHEHFGTLSGNCNRRVGICCIDAAVLENIKK